MRIDNDNVSDFVGMIYYNGTNSAVIDKAELINYGTPYLSFEIHTKYGWACITLGLFDELPEPWKIYDKEEGKYLSYFEL